jgi:hypothetical protein
MSPGGEAKPRSATDPRGKRRPLARDYAEFVAELMAAGSEPEPRTARELLEACGAGDTDGSYESVLARTEQKQGRRKRSG